MSCGNRFEFGIWDLLFSLLLNLEFGLTRPFTDESVLLQAIMIDKEANLENVIAAQAQEILLFKDLQKRHADIVTKKHDELK